jgi:hypothetical protein
MDGLPMANALLHCLNAAVRTAHVKEDARRTRSSDPKTQLRGQVLGAVSSIARPRASLAWSCRKSRHLRSLSG